MGVETNIGFDKFPKQGTFLNRRLLQLQHGADPGRHVCSRRQRASIIRLDDGRYLLTTECQFQLI